MQMNSYLRLGLTITAIASWTNYACAEPDPAHLVQASLVADVDAAVPGQSFTLGVRLKMAAHWHTYWINPGETGNATQFKFSGPAGVEFGPVAWPLPYQIGAIGGISFG